MPYHNLSGIPMVLLSTLFLGEFSIITTPFGKSISQFITLFNVPVIVIPSADILLPL